MPWNRREIILLLGEWTVCNYILETEEILEKILKESVIYLLSDEQAMKILEEGGKG